MPMLGKITGVPPAMLTPRTTASTTWFRWMWPGVIWLKELMTPTIGDSISLRV